MAIEVRIPTILRTFTGGAKSVEGSGDTLDALLADLDVAARAGCVTGWSTTPACAGSSTSTSTTRTCASSAACTAPVKDGDTVTVLPAVAGGMR